MFNTTDEYIIITFSLVNNPFPCHPYLFITENYSSKFTITRSAFTCSKLTIETLEQSVKYVQH